MVSAPSGFLSKLKNSHEELWLSIDSIQGKLNSPSALKVSWAYFQDKVVSHFRLVEEMIKVYSSDGLLSEKIAEALIVNLKDLKIKLLFLMDTIDDNNFHSLFKKFALEFPSFAKDLLAEIKMEQMFLMPDN